MKPESFSQQVKFLVSCSDDPSKLRAKRLNEYQKDHLAAAYMRSLGRHANEVITDAGLLDDITGAVLNYLEASIEDRKELATKLIDMLVMSAHEGSEKAIDDCVDDAITELAINRQFYHDDYSAEQMLAEDTAKRVDDMRKDQLRAA